MADSCLNSARFGNPPRPLMAKRRVGWKHIIDDLLIHAVGGNGTGLQQQHLVVTIPCSDDFGDR
jgi:hypothetical protein